MSSMSRDNPYQTVNTIANYMPKSDVYELNWQYSSSLGQSLKQGLPIFGTLVPLLVEDIDSF
jgi:hypothetical protein